MYATILLAALTACADENPGEGPNQEAERRREVSEVANAKVRHVKVTVDDEPPADALLQPQSILRWSNPTVGSIYGEVFLWTAGGRPVAICSIFHRYDRASGWDLELVSTSGSPVRATEGQKTLWIAESAGIRFDNLPAAPPPSEKSATRLSQMRKLAARFSAELVDQRNDNEVVRELRLLTQPAYRYSAVDAGVIDGAIFAIVEATDPEVWVLLEAVKNADSAAWKYALARMDSGAMQARLDGQVVQTWDKVENPWAINRALYTVSPFPPHVARTDAEPASP